MTYFPPKNGPVPTPDRRASQELYEEAHRNFAIGYSDVALRDPKTGNFFFPKRNIEPEKGSRWFIGGRIAVGETTEQSAARHVLSDTGLSIPAGRFSDVSHFAIAHVNERPGQQSLIRHAINTVLVANLKPDEVEALSHTAVNGTLSPEYDGGAWYNPDTDRDNLPDPLKQFLRDFSDRKVMENALQAMALGETERST